MRPWTNWISSLNSTQVFHASSNLAGRTILVSSMKDHDIKLLVNDLTEIAIKYHACNQLRENIDIRVRAALTLEKVL